MLISHEKSQGSKKEIDELLIIIHTPYSNEKSRTIFYMILCLKKCLYISIRNKSFKNDIAYFNLSVFTS